MDVGDNLDKHIDRFFRVSFNIDITISIKFSCYTGIITCNLTTVKNDSLGEGNAHRQQKQENDREFFHSGKIFDKDIKNMDSLSEIKKSIKKITSGERTCRIFTAKVVRADGETCEVDYEGLRLTDVRLRSVVNGEESGVLLTPKADSFVTVADLSGDLTQTVVIGFSEVESVDITAGGEIHLNGDSFGGLIRIEDLVGDLNRIVETFNSHTHTVADGVAAPPEMPMNRINRNSIENDKIKHGDR